MFNSAIKAFLEHAIDRHIHLTGHTCFDSDSFLATYLPLEAGLLLEELPIEIHTPILLISLPSDSYDLEEAISIVRIPEPMQLARVRLVHGSHEVNEYLLEQASHALVLGTISFKTRTTVSASGATRRHLPPSRQSTTFSLA